MRVGENKGRPSSVLLAGLVAAASIRQGAAQNTAFAGHANHGGCGAQLGARAQNLVSEDDQAVQTEVTVISTAGIPGYTTFQIGLILHPEVENVYALFGDNRGLEFPPAYQVATPFGADTGGVNPTFFSYSPQSQYDSWLTIGITTGDQAAKISQVGMAFDIWNEQNALLSAPDTGGSVFWMDPDQATESVVTSYGTRKMTIAQLTLRTVQTSARCAFDTQGRSVGHSMQGAGVADWEENCIEVMVGGPQSGWGSHSSTHVTAPPPAPPPPPPSSTQVINGFRSCPAPPPGRTDGLDSILGALVNGHWVISGTEAANQHATAICFSGYEAVGVNDRACRVEGLGTPTAQYRWAPSQVYCEPVGGVVSSMPCPSDPTRGAPSDLYGTWTVVNGIGVAKTARLSCPGGATPLGPHAVLSCNGRGSDVGPPVWVFVANRAHCPRPATPPPPPPSATYPRGHQDDEDDDSSSTTYVLLVLVLVGGAAGYVAKDKGLGPFADGGAGGASLVSATAKADSTIYDTGGDETL